MAGRLHSLTHRLPGVPPHDEHADGPHAHASGHQGRTARAPHRHGEPRVLVRWQRWIASLGPQRRSGG
jgi:hypothetical protein